MEVSIRYLPTDLLEWELTDRLANEILHNEDLFPRSRESERLINFQVNLNPSKAGGVGNDGSGTLTLPTSQVGFKFLNYVKEKPFKVGSKKIKFFRVEAKSSRYFRATVLRLQRTPYVDPKREEVHREILQKLQDKLRVDKVQFGVLFRRYSGSGPAKLTSREYSVEWEKDFSQKSTAWLNFEYDHKLIRILLGDPMTEQTCFSIAIKFDSIVKMGMGYDPAAYVCFDTTIPPIFEYQEFNRALVGNDFIDNRKFRHRTGGLDEGHARVAPYCHKLRITLYNEGREDAIKKFRGLCTTAELAPSLIFEFKPPMNIEAGRHDLCGSRTLHQLTRKLDSFKEWPVAFQLQCLLHNALLNTLEISDLLDQRVCGLYKKQPTDYVAQLLQAYNGALPDRPATDSAIAYFDSIANKTFLRPSFNLSQDYFHCCHITFAPTRMILEGPFPTQSNRIIRRYEGFKDHFIRVDFRDEDKLEYRWDREVDGTTFLEKRVGGVLRNGFQLGHRQFEFLAYSNSALREHAVWFVHPFDHPVEGLVNAAKIRESIGDFRNENYSDEDERYGFPDKDKKLLQQPSKFAARIAQAFTATRSSVKIRRDEWEMMDDLGQDPYLFTDGVGTISQSLADEIWEALCRDKPGMGDKVTTPTAFQIRFQGFKGMVAVDKEMDKQGTKIRMRLRPSMRKFGNRYEEESSIEIARAFDRPNYGYLNRPLVAILEDRGVSKDVFIELVDAAVSKVYQIDDSLDAVSAFLRDHSLGSNYNVGWIFQQLDRLGGYIENEPKPRGFHIDNPFLHQLREVAKMHVFREIKHDARIQIPDSYLLVGVADEGPAYKGKEGYENVYTLPEGHIFACIQRPGDTEPTYLSGSCSISRSPVAHPGDVQRVHAIGKPPANSLFSHLKNVVVLPSVGRRSLASCLGGGDLDGDLYSIILYPGLLPVENYAPARYTSAGTFTLDRETEIEDICDFVVEYINSDVLGLLSNRLLVIADQSKEGPRDELCLKLAELCSQAVDYPKNGIAVDIQGDNKIPSPLIRQKPDWHAAEIISPRQTDYYESPKALGSMYRRVILAEPKGLEERLSSERPEVSCSSWKGIDDLIRAAMPTDVVLQSNEKEVGPIFARYKDELQYVCSTHTISNTPGAKLLEAEVVMGTILAKCTQKRWRTNRVYRMKTHMEGFIAQVRRELKDVGKEMEEGREKQLKILERAWWAWDFCVQKDKGKKENGAGMPDEGNRWFGTNSFALIVLGIILHSLDSLENMEAAEAEPNDFKSSLNNGF